MDISYFLTNRMYKDIITYRLAADITERHILDVSKKVRDDWMSQQSGFLSWEIHKNIQEGYTDIVSWKDKKSAKDAERNMSHMPHAKEWYACYDPSSIVTMNITKLVSI